MDKLAGQRIPGIVQSPQRRADLGDQAVVFQISRRKRPAGDMTGDEQARLVVNQLRRQAQASRRDVSGRLVRRSIPSSGSSRQRRATSVV